MGDDKPIDRRKFFREGIRQLFGQVEKAAAPVQRFAEEIAKLDRPVEAEAPSGSPPSGSWTDSGHGGQEPVLAAARAVTLPLVLRPPGAVPEPGFFSACTQCGDCIKACPAQCIVADPQSAEPARRFPHVIAESKPCVVCEELACMNACPTGALQLIPRFAINMGKAVWGQGKCVRPDGEDCTKCLDICPMGTAAIDLNEQGEVVIHQACTGCGQCQHICPTTPRAIVVVPSRR